ncbi:MAG: AAA family ATPase [bacterium]|nr:AAA family ATPase [bacterium]
MNKQKPFIIAIVGLAGSGKTEAVARFLAHGFIRVGFNDALYEEVDRRGLERTQEHERPVREEMRRQEGMAVMAKRMMPRIEKHVADGNHVVIESLYSWSEYKHVKERYHEQFRVLAIYSPPDMRYERLQSRAIRPLTNEEAGTRDYTEIEHVEKAGPIAMADWTMLNIGSKKVFLNEIDALILRLLS